MCYRRRKTTTIWINESVKTRLFPYETRTISKISTLLDPCFKKEGFRSPENTDNSANLLEKEMSMMKMSIQFSSSSKESLTNNEPEKSTSSNNNK